MNPTLYEKDFNLWLEKTIQHLINNDFESLDKINLIEELKELGKSDKTALESNLMILLAHLLKLTVQSDASQTMKNSWSSSVIEHRKRVKKQLSKIPSLKSYFPTILEEAYTDGKEIAIREGKLAHFGVRIPDELEYPNHCPFSIEQILNDDFYGN